MKKAEIISIIIVGLVLIGTGKAVMERMDTSKLMTCYEQYCSKTTLDQFSSCKDIGVENTGFLSSEHYYLCDGQKVTNSCLEYDYKKTEKKYISFGMKCEEKK